MIMSFTFNGIRKPYLRATVETNRPPFAPVNRNILKIKGMPGGYLQDSEVDVRTISVVVKLTNNGYFSSLQKLKEDFADWLVTDEPRELIFDDEPDRIYYAVVDGGVDLDEIVEIGKGTINFICPDPYKYKDSYKSYILTADEVNLVTNEGTVPADPIFIVDVNSLITEVEITTEQGYMRIGHPDFVDEEKYQAEEIVFQDDMSSLAGWGPATQVDNGYVSGNINTNGSAFYPETFGQVIHPPEWQGPSLKKSLPEPIDEFEVEIKVNLQNSQRGTGMIEIYLLDEVNNVVGKIGIEDRLEGSSLTHAKARAGNSATGVWFASESANNHNDWIDFDGVMKLYRYEGTWYAYWACVDGNGNHYAKRGSLWNIYYYDYEGKYQQPISQIQVAFRLRPDTSKFPMFVKGITVKRLRFGVHKQEPNKIPYIARAGDRIVIDHRTNDILINGESRTDLKDFGASFFQLKEGPNLIRYSPDNVDVKVQWRERFK